MLGDPFSRQASSACSTACFSSRLFLHNAPIKVSSERLCIAPCQPLQVSVFPVADSPAHLRAPSVLTATERSLSILLFPHRRWRFALLFALLPLPKLSLLGHQCMNPRASLLSISAHSVGISSQTVASLYSAPPFHLEGSAPTSHCDPAVDFSRSVVHWHFIRPLLSFG